MKRLLLVRHAKAVKDEGRTKDFDRPLSPRGEQDAAEMGRRLARHQTHPGAILTSPAARAIATARLIARELDFPWDEIVAVKAAYLADAATLLHVLRDVDERRECALLVGHNPGVSELAQALARHFAQELPTCGVVAFDLPADTWAGVRRGSGLLRLYDYPKNRP